MTPDEAKLLRQARMFRDLIAREGWKEYVKVIEAQIEARLKLLERPLHDLPEHVVAKEADLAARAAVMESIKGAVSALRLAISLPQSAISAAEEIASKEGIDDAGDD